VLPVFCSPAYDMFAFIEVYGRKAGSYVSNYGRKILGILLGFLCKSCPEPASTEIFQEMWIPITTTVFLYLLTTKTEDSSFVCGALISVRILCISFINVSLYVSIFYRYILNAHKVAVELGV
jgi:hypothetical protein